MALTPKDQALFEATTREQVLAALAAGANIEAKNEEEQTPLLKVTLQKKNRNHKNPIK